MVGCRHSFRQIVSYWLLNIEVLHALFFSLLHTADAPIEVGCEPICGVVGKGNLAIDVEGLMTDEHTLLKTLPCKVLWRGEAAITDESPFVIQECTV